jgi:potassium-dependent mechanosensitive channel
MENNKLSFIDIITTTLMFLERADIQNQVLMIILSLIIGWLFSKYLWNYLQKTFPKITNFIWEDAKFSLNQYLAIFLQSIDFPLITLGLLRLNELLFLSQNWTKGLINIAFQLVFVYLIYRLLLAFLYGTFSLKFINQYHLKLFAPLFTLFVLITIIDLYTDLNEISGVILLTLFNTPITVSRIFFLIIGLYFWVIIVILFEELLLIYVKKQNNIEQGKSQATLLLIRYFLITLGIVLILGYVGVNGTALAAISGGLSVGIGFGLKEIFSNFISGILLLFEKVLKPGDIISIEGQTCEVKQLGIRATTVKMSVDNSEKIIPNQTFFTQNVTTYTGSNNLVYCSLLIGVGYNSNAEEVINLLLEIAYNHHYILKTPSPVAFFLNFGDSCLNFELKFWLDDINIKKRVISDLNCQILTKFANNKIEIPYPQRDIHIKKN